MLKHRAQHALLFALSPLLLTAAPMALVSQAPAAARQLGTVTAVSGTSITLKPASGAEVSITVAPDAPVLQLPPGSTDLKTATPARLEDVTVGDRILASGTKDASDALVASRIVLMKSTDIAARNDKDQHDWQRNALGGLVRAVDGTSVTIVSGAKVLQVTTTPSTVFKRYADDSVAFADVKPGTLAEVHAGDQLRARGTVAEDRMSVTADEIVYGQFENLSGIVSAVDQTAQTITLKDSATKKTVTVYVTQKSDLRKLPPEAAARFSARNGAGHSGADQGSNANGAPAESHASTQGAPASAPSPGGAPAHAHNAGMDLSQMLGRLPTQALADLHAGEAVMIVASQKNSGNPTAVTLLSGVEQILSATPAGSAPVTLSPWNMGGMPEGGGGQ